MAYDLTTVLGGGGIKAVQRGYVYLSSTFSDVTITAVDTTKSFVTLSFEGDSDTLRSFTRAVLTSSTNLRIERRSSLNGIDVSWEVVEFA